MRAPKWFKEQLAAEGARVLERESTDEQAAESLTDQVLAKDEPFARAIIGEYARRQLRTWTAQHTHSPADGEPDSQLDLFPDIPRRLEIAPGRFADQAVMNRHDWDCALRQARTKASNASGYADAVKRAYDQVRPLLTDDELTTADVWKRGPGRATGGA